MGGYFDLRDEFVELRLLLGDVADECAVYFVLQVGLPVLVAVIGLWVEFWHLQLLRVGGGT